MRKFLALLTSAGLLAGCTSIVDTTEPRQLSQVQLDGSDDAGSLNLKNYEVAGFASVDEDWAYKFSPPASCDGEVGSCISLTLQTPTSCERATLSYQLESIHRKFEFYHQDVELDVRTNFSSGKVFLHWKDPAWERVKLNSVQCVSPILGNIAFAAGNLAPKLTVNSGFPDDFWPLSNRIAFDWKEPADCKPFYGTCWSMSVFSATPCEAVFASFEIRDAFGKVLDSEVLATRNLSISARNSTAVQFGTSSKIDSEQLESLRIHVNSINCLDAPIQNESAYANFVSQVELPAKYCEMGDCNPVIESATGSELGQILEYLQQYPKNPSAGTGYRVRCNDGTYSNSGGRQGACSWHGGVSG